MDPAAGEPALPSPPRHPRRLVFLGTPAMAVAAAARPASTPASTSPSSCPRPDQRRGRGERHHAHPGEGRPPSSWASRSPTTVDDVLGAGADLGVVVAFGADPRAARARRAARWSTSTSRCCPGGGARPRSSGRSWPATSAPACASWRSRRASTPAASTPASEIAIRRDEHRRRARARSWPTVGSRAAGRRPSQAGLGDPAPQVGEPTYAAQARPPRTSSSTGTGPARRARPGRARRRRVDHVPGQAAQGAGHAGPTAPGHGAPGRARRRPGRHRRRRARAARGAARGQGPRSPSADWANGAQPAPASPAIALAHRDAEPTPRRARRRPAGGRLAVDALVRIEERRRLRQPRCSPELLERSGLDRARPGASSPSSSTAPPACGGPATGSSTASPCGDLDPDGAGRPAPRRLPARVPRHAAPRRRVGHGRRGAPQGPRPGQRRAAQGRRRADDAWPSEARRASATPTGSSSGSPPTSATTTRSPRWRR